MKLRIVPASRGLVWLQQGLNVARQQPFHFMGLLGLVVSAAILLTSLPLIGPLLVLTAMPAVWMGFMLASRRAMAGERVTPGVLLEAVRSESGARTVFVKLGAAYVIATLIVMQLAHIFGPGANVLGDVMEQSKTAGEVLNHPDVQRDLLWRLALSLPVSLLFWHTPALVMWARIPVGKALFFSGVASWRNLGAFLLYGIGWMTAIAALVVVDRFVLSFLPQVLGSLLAVSGGLWLFSAFYASLYFSVTDCFDSTPSEPSGTSEQPDMPETSESSHRNLEDKLPRVINSTDA